MRTVIETRQVTVLGGQYPNVLVLSPAEGSTYSQLTNIVFNGSASDAEDGDISLNLQWSSSIDGPLGTRPSVTSVLSVGSHTITISITDSSGNTTSVRRQITVSAI